MSHCQLRAAVVGAALVAAAGVLTASSHAAAAGVTRSIRTFRIHAPVYAVAATEASCTTGMPSLISGYYYDKKNVAHGFVDWKGEFTTINDPSATTVKKYQGTWVYGVTNNGTLGGQYYDSKGVSHGFIDQAGQFTTINDPSAGTATGQGTAVYGMNDLGVISGWFTDSNNVNHSFEDLAGKFTTFTDPSGGTKNKPGNYLESGNLGTLMPLVNDGGVLSGSYVDNKGVSHGAEEVAGRYITINDPSAGAMSGEGTAINDFNNLGAIVGEYFDSKDALHGFLDQGGEFTAINDPNATSSGGTEALQINNEGVIIGDWARTATSPNHGFVDIGGKFTTIDDPNGVFTSPQGMPLSLCP